MKIYIYIIDSQHFEQQRVKSTLHGNTGSTNGTFRIYIQYIYIYIYIYIFKLFNNVVLKGCIGLIKKIAVKTFIMSQIFIFQINAALLNFLFIKKS